MADRSDAPCLVWFRDDLRLSDHPALHAAAATKRPVICLYVLDETSRQAGARPIGGAARWWLAQSLRALEKRLGAVGVQLLLRKGSAARIITDLARETGASDVFWNRIAQAPHQAIEDEIASAFRDLGVNVHAFAGDLLAAPDTVRTKEGRGLRVFTPFWRRVQAMGAPPDPLPAPRRLRTGPSLAGETVESFGLEPTRPDWAGGR
jgi:deoxyribodipyrimidine photo-lyase